MKDKKTNPINALIVAGLVMVLAACATHGKHSTYEKDIVDTAIAAGSFDTLVAAVKAADLVETLRSEGPFTVLAPTDEAFAKLPAGTVQTLLKPENKEKLRSILTYHVVSGSFTARELSKQMSVVTVNGKPLVINYTRDPVVVQGAKVISKDIVCSNGVIQVIDTVLIP